MLSIRCIDDENCVVPLEPLNRRIRIRVFGLSDPDLIYCRGWDPDNIIPYTRCFLPDAVLLRSAVVAGCLPLEPMNIIRFTLHWQLLKAALFYNALLSDAALMRAAAVAWCPWSPWTWRRTGTARNARQSSLEPILGKIRFTSSFILDTLLWVKT